MDKTIFTKNGVVLIYDFGQECLDCITSNVNKLGVGKIEYKKDKREKRVGYCINRFGKLYCCTSEKIQTPRFQEKVNQTGSLIGELYKVYLSTAEQARKTEQDKVETLLHNLVSFNSHNRDVFNAVLPERMFSHNINSTIDIAEKEIKNNPRAAAKSFLKLIKLNAGLKAEFSAYRIINSPDYQLSSIKAYNLHSVFMSLAYRFYSDYEDNNVSIFINEYREKANFDFDTVFVALYHLFDNSVKYARPGTTIDIDFQRLERIHLIIFSMESIHVLTNKREEVFNKGYSGVNAKNAKKSGTGLGMYIAKELLEMNNIEFEAKFGADFIEHDNIEYSENKFFMKIPVDNVLD